MTLRTKTILGIALIELILLIILISSVLRYMGEVNQQSITDYSQTSSKIFASAIKDAVLSDDLASLQSSADEILTNQSIVYVKILNPQAIELAKSGIEINNSAANTHHIEYDIQESARVYGKIKLGVSTARFDQSLQKTRNLAAMIAAIEMFLVSLFSFFFGKYLTKQLKVLQTASKEIVQGKLDINIPIISNDEVADVAKSFNTMAKSLAENQRKTMQYQAELQQMNLSLEEKVKQRTAQLESNNQELTNAYNELKATKNKLVFSEKMASIGQLAAGVSHEVNNPLGFILMNLKTLQEYFAEYDKLLLSYDQQIKDQDQQLLAAIEELKQTADIEFVRDDTQTLISDCIDGTNRIADIVSRLKTFARNDDIEFSAIDINECINNSIKITNNELKYKCEIKLELADLPKVMGNSVKLSQVFINILTNAAHAIVDNGIITIKTFCEKNQVIIKISDTGKGIAADVLPKLFDPFFTTKGVGEGTGLGLSISHSLIEEHQGTISVTSEQGVGTEFTISLPVA